MPKTKRQTSPTSAKPRRSDAASDSDNDVAAQPVAIVKPKGVHTPAALLQVLRERIARHDIPPGAKLREQDAAVEFGLPRSLIREVFSALEQRGLIERIPNRGAVVNRLDLPQLLQIYDTREVLEGLCVRLATEKAPPESWQDLLDLFEGPMVKHVADSNFDDFLAGYDLFRRRSIEAADNPVVAEMLDSIWDKAQVLIRRIIILPGRAQIGLAEHTAVLRAMRRGDAIAAEELRRQNMRSAKETLLRYQKYLV